jgi:hypothetical protein
MLRPAGYQGDVAVAPHLDTDASLPQPPTPSTPLVEPRKRSTRIKSTFSAPAGPDPGCYLDPPGPAVACACRSSLPPLLLGRDYLPFLEAVVNPHITVAFSPARSRLSAGDAELLHLRAI